MALTEENSPSTESLIRKLHEILTDTDNDVGQFSFKEETIQKLMQELYKEIIAPSSPPSNATLHAQDESMELNAGEDMKDEGDFDDEWMARVLSWGQVLDTSDWF